MIFPSQRFFQKTKEQIQLYCLSTCFCSFFGKKWRHQKDISKLIDLYNQLIKNLKIEIWTSHYFLFFSRLIQNNCYGYCYGYGDSFNSAQNRPKINLCIRGTIKKWGYTFPNTTSLAGQHPCFRNIKCLNHSTPGGFQKWV